MDFSELWEKCGAKGECIGCQHAIWQEFAYIAGIASEALPYPADYKDDRHDPIKRRLACYCRVQRCFIRLERSACEAKELDI